MNTTNIENSKNNDSPQVYIACLSSYNSGYLHGKWCEAIDEDVIHETIKEVLKTSPVSDAEEWAIHDYSGFYDCDLGENPCISELVEVAEFLDEHGRLGAELMSHFNDIEYAKKAMDENYQGEYTSLEDYAYSFAADTMEIPAHIEPYFDYEKFAQDMELSGDIFTIELGYREIHVFSSF